MRSSGIASFVRHRKARCEIESLTIQQTDRFCLLPFGISLLHAYAMASPNNLRPASLLKFTRSCRRCSSIRLPIKLQQLPSRQYATTKDEQKKDFTGQLWESTTSRVQRENDEQARYAAQRTLGGAASRNFGATVCMFRLKSFHT